MTKLPAVEEPSTVRFRAQLVFTSRAYLIKVKGTELIPQTYLIKVKDRVGFNPTAIPDQGQGHRVGFYPTDTPDHSQRHRELAFTTWRPDQGQ